MGAVSVEVNGQRGRLLAPAGPMVMGNGSWAVAEVNQSRGAALRDIREGDEGLDRGQVSVATAWSMELVQAQLPTELMDSQVGAPSHQRAPGRVCTRERARGVDRGATLVQHGDASEQTPSRVLRVQPQEQL